MNKRIGLYPGCVMPTEQYGYEISIRQVLPELGIELIDVGNTSCCGAPFKNINIFMQTYLSARNIAVFEMKGLDIFTPCPQCNLSLQETKQRIEGSAELNERILTMLEEEEGLKYRGDAKIYQTLDLLHDVVGTAALAEKVIEPLDLNIACHYGCQTVRYTGAERPDIAEHPMKMERIITAIGGRTGDYSEKLNCCGGPLIITHRESSFTKAGEKIKAVKDRGFDALSIVCPLGGRVLDSKQDKASEMVGEKLDLPVFYLTQLVGLSLGKSPGELGIDLNRSPAGRSLK